jgi:GntR family transcriptional regulator
MLSIDHASPLPLNAQVERLLRKLARQPQYQNGSLMPDELSLAAELGVSRGTVRAAIGKLVYEGILKRKAGVGTRVAHQMESGIRAWRSFTREMSHKGIRVKNFQVEYSRVAAPANAAAALEIAAGTPVWRLERLRGWEAKPVLHTISWFHPRMGLKGTEQFDQPLYDVIEQATGLRPHRAKEEFLAVRAESRMARLLQVTSGTPLLLRRHTVLDAGARPFEYAEVRYVSDRFTLTLDMRRGEE